MLYFQTVTFTVTFSEETKNAKNVTVLFGKKDGKVSRRNKKYKTPYPFKL